MDARTITLRDTHPETGRARIIETRWISAASYIDGAGAIQLNNHRLKPVGLNYGLKVRIRVALTTRLNRAPL